MTISEWLIHSTSLLEPENGTARLDAEVLLCDLLNKDKSWIISYSREELSEDQLKTLNKQLRRRAKHEPLAYIREKSEFYGREFMVDKRVLVPRPESETMIDLFKLLDLPVDYLIADVGSGSGALGVTAALEKPTRKVYFFDIDENTLEVTKSNSEKHKVGGQYYSGDLLSHENNFHVLLCNLPYVPDDHTVNQAAMLEPKIAIFGGQDGLDLYRRLFKQLETNKFGSPIVLTESLPFQHNELQRIASISGYKQTKEDDFIQQFEISF